MSSIDSAAIEAIEKNYSAFLLEFPEFIFDEADQEVGGPGLFTMNLAAELAQEARIDEPVVDVSHRRRFAGLVVGLKTLVRRLARPFVKLVLVRQQRVNNILVSLAYNTASLELRLSQLEELQRKHKGN